jgi:hypothetical protein
MNAWPYVRGGLVAASLLGGAFGSDWRQVDFGHGLPEIAAAVFVFGIVGMLFVVCIQAFNRRSDPEWFYPGWALNPFKLGQPLQFFHLGGYFIFAAGVGALLRSLFVPDMPLAEPVVLTFWGAGTLVGVWCCARIFRKKMVRVRASPEQRPHENT